MAYFMDFLDQIFLGDEALITYVQELCGMALFGKVFKECMIIAYGDGKNGKSTLFNLIGKCLGKYRGNLSSDILSHNVVRNVKPEFAELKGKRLVITAELQEGTYINAKVVKNICSTDDIYAEKKYEKPFAFSPSHTVVMYTNHLPQLREADEGILRRLEIIPFLAKITNDIQNYTDQLFEVCSGAVMKWLIDGARRIYQNKFVFTKSLSSESSRKEFQTEANSCLGFITQECTKDDSAKTASKDLYEAYKDWCINQGMHPESSILFGKALRSCGFESSNIRVDGKVTGVWKSIKIS